MFWATFGFTAMFALVRSLTQFHVFEIIFFRSVITSLLCMGYLKQQKIALVGKRQGLLLIRAIVGLSSMTFFFITIQRLPLGASVSLRYLAPIFTAIFAVLILREKVKKIQALYFLGALIGVLLLKGFDARIDSMSLIFGILGAAFGGLVYVIIRKIGNSEHPMVIINYFMLLATILSGLAMIPFWKSPNPKEWLALIALGLTGFFSQVFMTKALQNEMASKVAPIKYMEVVYSMLIGFFWFGESIPLLSMLGIGLIIGCMLLNLRVRQA